MIQYEETGYAPEYVDMGNIAGFCDLCGENTGELRNAEGGLFLCPNCYYQFQGVDNGYLKDSIMKFSIGNVC